jgi:hypothetical protein
MSLIVALIRINMNSRQIGAQVRIPKIMYHQGDVIKADTEHRARLELARTISDKIAEELMTNTKPVLVRPVKETIIDNDNDYTKAIMWTVAIEETNTRPIPKFEVFAEEFEPVGKIEIERPPSDLGVRELEL